MTSVTCDRSYGFNLITHCSFIRLLFPILGQRYCVAMEYFSDIDHSIVILRSTGAIHQIPLLLKVSIKQSVANNVPNKIDDRSTRITFTPLTFDSVLNYTG